MKLDDLHGLLKKAHERAQAAKDAIDNAPDNTSAEEYERLEADLDEAVDELERTSGNYNKRREQESALAKTELPEIVVENRKAEPVARGAHRAEQTYRPDANVSFFKDLRDAKDGDPAARERLMQNNKESAIEKRAGINQTATSGGEFVPPVWLEEMYAAKLRAGRPFVSAVGTKPWPPGTNSLNFPAITTGASTAVQTDGNTVSNTDWVTSSYTAAAQTVAGRTVASYQLIDLGWAGVDQVIYEDLVASYAAQFDSLAINGSATNAKGVLNVTGVNAVTYTTATPKPVDSTVANSAYYQVFLGKNAIEKNAFVPVDLLVGHPSFWNWFLTGLDTANRPLSIALTGVSGFNATSAFDPTDVPAAPTLAGNIAGMGFVSDANIPVNLGGGTNESRLVILNRRGFDIYETTPTFKIADQTSVATLQYQFVLYGYYGVVSRQPKMISVVAGTGMIVQSGF